MSVHHIKWPLLNERHYDNEEAKRFERGDDISKIYWRWELFNQGFQLRWSSKWVSEVMQERGWEWECDQKRFTLPTYPLVLANLPQNPGKNGSTSECSPFLPLILPFPLPPLLLPLPHYPPSNPPHCHTSFWRRYVTIESIKYRKSQNVFCELD